MPIEPTKIRSPSCSGRGAGKPTQISWTKIAAAIGSSTAVRRGLGASGNAFEAWM
jgi:hypothetical protein